MYQLFGFPTHNTYKVLYVLEALNQTYELSLVDLARGQHKTPEFQALNPHGRVPILRMNSGSLSESGAICRYLAHAHPSTLFPHGLLQRARLDQWIDSFSCHLGAYIATIYFETIIKKLARLGEPNQDLIAHTQDLIGAELAVLENTLATDRYILGNAISIADYFAFAYIEQTGAIEYSLKPFDNVRRWQQSMETDSAVKRGRLKMQEALSNTAN